MTFSQFFLAINLCAHINTYILKLTVRVLAMGRALINKTINSFSQNQWIDAIDAFNQSYYQLVSAYLNQGNKPVGLCPSKQLLAHIWQMENQLEVLLADADELNGVEGLATHADCLNKLTLQAQLMLQLTSQPAC
ncbi:hypothetical protein GCM10027341_44200 [Spirosoma knui]